MERKRNAELIEWLRGELSFDGYLYFKYPVDSFTTLLVVECVNRSWIELEQISLLAMSTTYKLTALGEIALGIVATETDTPQTSTPEPAPATGEYRVEEFKFVGNEYGTGKYKVVAPNGSTVDWTEDEGNEWLMRRIANAINTETATLRSENARLASELEAARERIAELQGSYSELSAQHTGYMVSQLSTKDLKAVIQEAFDAIQGDGTPVAILGKLHEILEPYTDTGS